MTRLHILSDLHLEFGAFDAPAVEADVTILAGDTATRARGCPWPDAAAFFGRPVVLVAGNHDYYGTKVDTAPAKLKTAAKARGAIFLENEEVIVGGVRILGCTLWSDFRFFAGDDMERVRADAHHCVGERYGPGINDFRKIRVARDGYRRFRPRDAALAHQASVAWLREVLAVPFAGPTVVVTHHAPSARCVPDSWLADRMVCAYASRLDALIEDLQPEVWVWGHIHQAVPAFSIGRTRMVSNPRGYVPDGLNPHFRPDLVIEV